MMCRFFLIQVRVLKCLDVVYFKKLLIPVAYWNWRKFG